jgi:UDP-glucuronate 4-epimerase
MTILVTGSAGFIGFHLSKKLAVKKKVVGIDNLNKYYSVQLKKDRLKILKKSNNFTFYKVDITNYKKLDKIIKKHNIKEIFHLAAQAGVRYSIQNPRQYLKSNVIGFFNILETCKKNKIKFLFYASSSSVYGNNKNLPLKEHYSTDTPIQFYAATKKSNEIMAHSYSSLYGVKTIGLRFFTIYGAWGRPDMAYFKFSSNIQKNKTINVFNFGKHTRDFTFIDDAIKMLIALYRKKNNFKLSEVFNISNGTKVELKKFIQEIYLNFNKKNKIKYIEKQKGDMEDTLSSKIKISKIITLKNLTNYKQGLKKFITWYKLYYNVKDR